MMKQLNLLLAGTYALLMLAGCQSDPKDSEEYRMLLEDKQRLEERVTEKDSSVNDLLGAFNRISENLRTIRQKEGKLGEVSASVENGKGMEDQVMSDLASIDKLLDENRGLLAKLRKEAKANAGSMKALEKSIAELEMAINAKDNEITGLKEQLSSTNTTLGTLIEMYREKSQLAETQEGDLNRVYFALGTAKELRDNGVLMKEGGVVGVGAVKKIRTTDLNKSYFKEVDMTQTTEIPVLAKKAEVITSHPAGSFELVGADDKVDKLVIKDAAAFWSLSKYLVVVVN